MVAKLLHITSADFVVFGRKDFQQYMVIRRMVRDLDIPVSIISVETAREADGLAMSSRNSHLTEEQRRQAPVIRRALQVAVAAFRGGENDAANLRAIVKETIATAPLARIDYIDVVDAETLLPVVTAHSTALCAAAVFFGATRLIDNLLLKGAKTGIRTAATAPAQAKFR